jgi:sugar phosphate isomerase/epimerase
LATALLWVLTLLLSRVFMGIHNVHIKDRILGNDSVVQGKGAENFDRFFDKLREFDYSSGLIIKGSILLDVYGGAN